MGSDLYRVRVLEKQERSAALYIEVVHPDSNYLSDNVSFALMLLREGVGDRRDAPLAHEVSFDDTLDRGWVELYARGFIERTDLAIQSGSPDGQSPEEWLKGTLQVTVSDPAWIAHLEPGQHYDSRAFDVAYDFKECAPIHPGQIDPNAPTPEPFIAVPGALFDGDLPAVIRAGAYSASAYRSVDTREGTFSPDQLQDLAGQVVLYQGKYDDSPELAYLHLAGGNVVMARVGAGYSGSSSSSSFTGTIGRAELVPGKRLGSRLQLSRVLNSLSPQLIAAQLEPDGVTFRVAVHPADQTLASLSEEQLMATGFVLMLTPLLPKDQSPSSRQLQPAPFSWTVEREVVRLFKPEERQLTKYINGEMVPAGDSLPQESALASRLARGFVARVDVVSAPAVYDPTQLDTFTEGQQREVFGRPWPELVLKVVLHYPELAQHLAKPVEARKLPYFGQAEPWEGPPAAPATEPTGFGASAPAPTAGTPPTAAVQLATPKKGNKKTLLLVAAVGCGGLMLLSFVCFVSALILS